jgi:3-deoxy-D-manno-octulosonic-acid transferase
MGPPGNIKLDVRIPPLSDAAQAALRRELGLADGFVLLGASTWPGEEAALLTAWRGVAAAGWKLLLVPRHAERRGELEALLAAAGVRYHLRSRGPAAGEVDVALADTTGELARLLTLAELVFVGKTLSPHTEGQTPVEAAAQGRPVLFGPGVANFRAIARELVAVGAAAKVADAEGLAVRVGELAADPAERARRGEAGRRWQAGNRGAAARTLAAIAKIPRGAN